MTAVTPEPRIPAHASRWDSLVWPRWLPVTARLPLIAQITGAVSLTALLTAPWWSSIPEAAPALETSVAAPRPTAVPLRPAVPQSPAIAPAASGLPGSETTERPAHLNLDVRHAFGSVDLSVAVDGKPTLASKLAGGGKRFGAFGKRSERGYTRTLDLPPGVHVVRVRVSSSADRFDQTRVERFDLASASVATLRVSADKSGLSLVAEPPATPPPAAPLQPPVHAAVAPPAPADVPAAVAAVPAAAPAATRTAQEANAVVDLLQSVRSILIAIAGFVASAATGFVVQEYLRTRRGLIFTGADAEAEQAYPTERRRRRRPGQSRTQSDSDSEVDESDGEPSSLRAE